MADQAEYQTQAGRLLAPLGQATFFVSGGLSTGDGQGSPPRFEVPWNGEIVEVVAYAETAPTMGAGSGDAVIIDLEVDGTTIWTGGGNRLAIEHGDNRGSTTTIDVPEVSKDQDIMLNIDQVGDTVAGSDLSVMVRIRPIVSQS